MIRNCLILSLVLLTVGCDQKPKRVKIDVNSRQVAIDFARISLSLPKLFHKFSAEELIYAIENADSSEIPEREKLERVRQIKALKINSIGKMYYIYVDTTNIDNTIIFQKEKYLKLDKEARQYILWDAEKSVNAYVDSDIKFERVDSQFFSGEKIQILKQKFKMNGPDWTRYMTLYAVTTKSNTFQIFVSRSDDEDFEDRITRMRVGV